MSYKVQTERIMDGQVQKLCYKEILQVKVIWRGHSNKEVTWELEEDMCRKYSQMFEKASTYMS